MANTSQYGCGLFNNQTELLLFFLLLVVLFGWY